MQRGAEFDLFFVLSGFLITGLLLDAKGQQGFFRTFYLRRTLRIFPLYYGALAVLTTAVILVFTGNKVLRDSRHELIWFWLYLHNWLVTMTGKWPNLQSIDHFWSLSVEEQFYLFWPLLVFVSNRRFLLRICIGILVSAFALRYAALLCGVPPVTIYVNTFARMDALAIGAIIALLIRTSRAVPMLASLARPTAVLSGGLLVVIFVVRRRFDHFDFTTQTYGFTLLAVFFSTVLFSAIVRPAHSLSSRVLSWAPLRYLGTISYGAYVFHQPLCYLIRKVWPRALQSNYIGNHLCFFAVLLITTMALATASYYLYEIHFLKLKNRFQYRHVPAAVVQSMSGEAT